MKQLFQSFLSRKFLLAVGSFLVLVANGQYTEAVAVIIAYIGVNGIVEAKTGGVSLPSTKVSVESHNMDDVDTGVIITGKDTSAVPLFDQELKEGS